MKTPQDALFDVAHRLCHAEDWKDPFLRPVIKRGVAVLWKQLTASERGDFLASLDHQNNLVVRKPNGRRS